ncbi:MAG: pyridoxine 5'-phosphate synthase [Bacteroidia bacterium]
MTRLSVNINKVALLRNSRGGNNPDLIQVAKDCERFGAQGITVHPRPDERHVRYSDLAPLKAVVSTEFNVEGYPSQKFMDTVLEVKPHQVTLVPDKPQQLTSDHGWDTLDEADFLREIVGELKRAGIRVSLFIDPALSMIEAAAKTDADRIELYTEGYAANYTQNAEKALAPYIKAAELAHELGLGVNAGHDLNLENLAYLKQHLPHVDEVSIGHALISDALYFGLENVIPMYLRKLE